VSLAAVPGALVTAVRLSGGVPADSASSDYSAEDGAFTLRRLAPGDYAVRVTPLDGEIGGFPLTPSYISARVEAVAQTDFEAEWWDSGESESDNLGTYTAITVAAGAVIGNRDVITNVDVTPPNMAAVDPVFPVDDGTQVRIDSAVLVNFSERIQASTLQGNFKLHVAGNHPSIGGNGVLINGGRTYVFTPVPALEFNTDYEIEVLGGLKDLRGVSFSPPFLSSFSTETRPTVAISDLQPRSVSEGSFVILVGAGFDPAVTNTVNFTFCGITPVADGEQCDALEPGGEGADRSRHRQRDGDDRPRDQQSVHAHGVPGERAGRSVPDRSDQSPGGILADRRGDRSRWADVVCGGRWRPGDRQSRFRSPQLPHPDRGGDGRRPPVRAEPGRLPRLRHRRDLSQVAVVDADPFSGQYRSVLAQVTVGDGQGAPKARPSGTRAAALT
jgi:hypothetical protein